MKKIFLALFLLLSGRAAAQDFKVIGYLPTYRFSWLNDIEFQRLTHVNIAFANPDAAGNLSCAGANIAPVVSKAHQNNCQVFVSLAGGYLPPDVEAIWNNLMLPANRAAFVQKIVDYVQAQNLDGVDVDLEWQYVNELYSPFVLELKAALAPLGKPVTAALPGSYRYPEITPQALAAFDWVNMMVYDLTGPWAPNQPGQHSPYPWAQQCIQYWLNQGVPAAKLTLGVPFYGYSFETNPVESFTYRWIVNQDPANAYLDQNGQRFWNGIPTIQAKTELALDEVAGIMIWELGGDAFGANADLSLLRAIDETITASLSGFYEKNTATLRIFPNPAADWSALELPEGESARVTVFNLQGQVVLEQAASNGGRIVLDLSALPAGMYGVSAQAAGQVRTGKFVRGQR
jgi:chitinase